jgi:lysosomal acid lipase/cholesteryl ester hydrolase
MLQLGNNRGNKYSKKSVQHTPTDIVFWNFSMDQFAFHDIPDSIDYILSTTGQPSLSYIGFSQGTAQAFAALSIHPTLNDKVDVFIALAPAMSPKGLTSPIVDSFVKASPDVLFLAFGRRAILQSATMWQAILYPPIFVRVIDMSLSFLFGWTGRNITAHQKLAAYPHLYSFTSTKSVVHWFQIIRNRTFQMYDDELQGPFSFSKSGHYYKVAKFPTKNIKTPIVLVYGGSDSLVDIDVMLKELPSHTEAKEIAHFEHLDFLWANSVDELVFPHVFGALDKFTDPNFKRKHPNWFTPSTYKTHQRNSSTFTDEDYESPRSPGPDQVKKVTEKDPPGSTDLSNAMKDFATVEAQQQTHKSAPTSRIPTFASRNLPSPARPASQSTIETAASRPEGWWSSDEVGNNDSNSPVEPILANSPSRTSLASMDQKGISVGFRGKSKAVGGVTRGEVEQALGAGRGQKKKGRLKE